MGKLQTGRFERLAARTYSIKGPGALVDLDETVLGVVLLERQGGMESHLMQQWETFGTRIEIGSPAGQFSFGFIHNPPGSNRIAVLDKFVIASGAETLFFISRGLPPATSTVGPGRGLDTRMATAMQPACVVHSLSSLTSSFGQLIGHVQTGTPIAWPVVLSPDGTFLWRANAATTLRVSLTWAEREAQPFEL